jgi:hypothetical protein
LGLGLAAFAIGALIARRCGGLGDAGTADRLRSNFDPLGAADDVALGLLAHTCAGLAASDRAVTGYASTLVRLRAALKQPGIRFIDEDETAVSGFG